jgi:hypothetical protein
MTELAKWYAIMAAFTALYLFLDLRPRKAGEWLGFAGVAAIWPVAFAYAVVSAIHQYRLR